MSWFGSLISHLINGLAQSIQNNLGNTLYDVIKNSTFATVPPFGQGSFSDILGAHATTQLGVFYDAFWGLGACFLLLSVYFLAMSLSSANNSSVKRERLKKGLIGLLITGCLMGVGQVFAVAAGQVLYYFTLFFLQIGGAGAQKVQLLSTGGNDGILNAIVNFIQVFMALLIWIVYQFRKIFLFAWMVFFPVAMALYANDRTKGITKLWWTEWIYQMAIPFGQAVVFGIAHVLTLGKTSPTLTDMFVALAGTIGLLGSAVYVRRLVDTIAQTFGTSALGHSSGEGKAHAFAMGMGAGVGDALGGAAVKAGSKTVGASLGRVGRAVDNSHFMRSKAEEAVKASPEKYAGAILGGASMDDMMMHHQMAAQGDPLQAGMVASKGGESLTGTRSPGGMVSAQRSRGRGTLMGGRTGSRTLGAMGDAMGQAKQGFAQSNTAKALGGWRQKQKDAGGVTGKAIAAVAPAIANLTATKGTAGAKISQGISRHMTSRQNKSERTANMRNHLRDVMEHNALQTRMPHINSQYDTESGKFTGPSAAEQSYESAREQFVGSMETTMGMSSENARRAASQSELAWDEGRHWKPLGTSTPQVQEAYRAAFTSYRPAQQDLRAKEAVASGEMAMQIPRDPHQNKKQGADAFLQDARMAMLQKR